MINKTFYRFIMTPTGPVTVLQVGIFLCIFWFFSQLRNIFTDFSNIQNCSLDSNVFDYLSILTSIMVMLGCLLGGIIISKQINFEYNKFKKVN